MLAAVTVGTAVKMPGTVCEGVAQLQQGTGPLTVSVEHPTGEFSVTLDSDPAHPDVVTKAALLRTARLLMRGEVMVPRSAWGRPQAGLKKQRRACRPLRCRAAARADAVSARLRDSGRDKS